MKPKHPSLVLQNHHPVKREVARELRRAMTVPEQVLWQHLRAHRCAGRKFRRQQVLEGFIVDFYCHEERLAVEVDGDVHDGQAEYDAARTRMLGAVGVRVVRVTNAEVMGEIGRALARIRKALYPPASDPPNLPQREERGA